MQSGIQWTKETPIVGFLVSFDRNVNGEVYELRQGRIMITSAHGEANSLVIQDETVSPMHAIMRINSAGEIQILDQLSEHGTSIVRADSEEVEQLSGEKAVVGHGDMIKFGDRSFVVCVIKRVMPASEQE
jgi:pSer/pThr/pTyr-binding forkhead associated (FHA) protein